MNNLNQREFADIIKQLSTLAQIKPSDDFKFRLRLSLNPYIPPSKISLYQKIIRYIASVIALLIFGSSGLAFAAQKSQPGDLLYPVKQTVDQVKKIIVPDQAESTPDENNDNLKENESETSQQLIPNSISDSVIPSPTAVISKPVNSQIIIKLETPVQLPIPSITLVPDTLPISVPTIVIPSPTILPLNSSNNEILSIQISLPVKLNIGL